MENAAEVTTEFFNSLSHLGPGPYEFVALTVHECGTSCDHCGTAIKNVYWFSAANGVEFKLGCDCAEIGFASSHDMIERIGNARRAQRAEVARAVQAQAEAQAQEERAAFARSLYEQNPEWGTAIETLASVDGFPGIFAADMKARIANGFEPTAKQAALLIHLYEVETGFVGSVGKRIELTLTVVDIVEIGSQPGAKIFYSAKDTEGRFVACLHSGKAWSIKGAERQVGRGDAVKVRAMVKAHEVCDGRSQTVIRRAMVLGVAA